MFLNKPSILKPRVPPLKLLNQTQGGYWICPDLSRAEPMNPNFFVLFCFFPEHGALMAAATCLDARLHWRQQPP